jgi:hypothetical protein
MRPRICEGVIEYLIELRLLPLELVLGCEGVNHADDHFLVARGERAATAA